MISVVIPFLDEQRALPATLDALFAQRGEFEVIAVDGGSSDGSRGVLAGHPGLRVIDAPRGRASQLNAGAAIARGETLLFLHADTLLPPGALDAVHAAAGGWGGFHHRFDGDDWRLALVSWLTNLRCRITGAIYGDQAMFVDRRLFAAAGGFPPGPMEDIALSERLLRKVAPVFLVQRVTTDARKFRREGVWLSLARVVAILVCRRLGWPIPKAFFRNVR